MCASLPIKSEWLEDFVLDLLRHKVSELGVIDELERLIRDRVEARRRTYGEHPKAVEKKLAETDRRIAHYYRAIGDGLDPSICQQHIAELTAKKQQLDEEASVLRREDYYDRALEMNVAELRRFARAFNEEFESLPFAAKRKAVLYFVEKVVIVERRSVEVHFKVPFDNNGIKLLTDEVVGGGPQEGDIGDSDGSKGLLSNVYMQPATGSHFTGCTNPCSRSSFRDKTPASGPTSRRRSSFWVTVMSSTTFASSFCFSCGFSFP